MLGRNFTQVNIKYPQLSNRFEQSMMSKAGGTTDHLRRASLEFVSNSVSDTPGSKTDLLQQTLNKFGWEEASSL